MNDFLYCLLSGLCTGGIIALIALGYTLVYGIIKLINFAHGEFYMVGAYAGFAVYQLLPPTLSPWLAIPALVLASGAAGAAIGGLTEHVAYKPIRRSGRLAALLTAIGVSFLLQNLFTFVHHGEALQYPCSVPGSLGELCQRSVTVFDGGIKVIHFAFLGVCLLLTAAVWWLVGYTRFGRAMRALSQDMDAAALMGINTDRVIRQTFILGGFLAGVAGALVALQGVIEPMMGFMPGLKAFVAAVVGGIGSIPGAVLGGLLLGVVENLVVYLQVPTQCKDMASFVLLILVLVGRPQGLLGKPEGEKA